MLQRRPWHLSTGRICPPICWPDCRTARPPPPQVIAFDESGNAWVGDDAGKVKVLRYHDPSSHAGGPPSNSGGSAPAGSLGSGGAGGPGSGSGSAAVNTGSFRHQQGGKLEVLASLQQSLLSKMAEGARTFWKFGATSGGHDKGGGKDKDKDGGAGGKQSPRDKEAGSNQHAARSITSEGPVR